MKEAGSLADEADKMEQRLEFLANSGLPRQGSSPPLPRLVESHHVKRLVAGGLLLAAAVISSDSAVAQDFYHGGVSPQTAARAGIYTPSPGDVLDAVALNPAGLSGLSAPTGNLLLTSGLAFGEFSNASNRNSAMRLRPGFVPFGALGAPVGKGRWKVGFGITPDFLSAVNWRYADSPGTAGATYGPQSERSQIVAYRGSAAAAFTVSPRLSLGVDAAAVYNENSLVAPFIFQSNPSLQGLKTLLALHTRGFGWGGGAGVTYRPVSRLSLGVAYGSPITINSTGHASGNMGAQFQVLGIPFQPGFTYSARVRVRLPQSVLVNGRWQATSQTSFSLQGDFANFRSAFRELPVHLTHGSNADINGFLQSSTIDDRVPLHWSNQYNLRGAAERSLGEHWQFSGGVTRRSSLVPNGTLTPLTAAIMKNGLSTGLEYRRDQFRFAAAYAINLKQSASVGNSGLLAGEFSHSHLSVGSQALTLGVSLRLR